MYAPLFLNSSASPTTLQAPHPPQRLLPSPGSVPISLLSRGVLHLLARHALGSGVEAGTVDTGIRSRMDGW